MDRHQRRRMAGLVQDLPRKLTTLPRQQGQLMTLQEAQRLVGNQPTYALCNMIRALGTLTWINTPDDERRRKAAKLILAHRSKKANS